MYIKRRENKTVGLGFGVPVGMENLKFFYYIENQKDLPYQTLKIRIRQIQIGTIRSSYSNIQRTFEPSLQGSVDQLPPTLDTTSILNDTTKTHSFFWSITTTNKTLLFWYVWKPCKAEILQCTSVSTGNRLFSEQGIFTNTSSHASLNLFGNETGIFPSVRRSVCKKEE